MNRKGLTTMAVLSAIILGAVGTSSGAEEDSDKPNVVFILADDLGWNELGCYGDTFHETPNLDGLAARGLRFTDAYTASCVCTPTRSSIMTGKYPARNDVTVYLYAKDGAPALDHMPLEEITIAEALKDAGYTILRLLSANGTWAGKHTILTSKGSTSASSEPSLVTRPARSAKAIGS